MPTKHRILVGIRVRRLATFLQMYGATRCNRCCHTCGIPRFTQGKQAFLVFGRCVSKLQLRLTSRFARDVWKKQFSLSLLNWHLRFCVLFPETGEDKHFQKVEFCVSVETCEKTQLGSEGVKGPSATQERRRRIWNKQPFQVASLGYSNS